jgi:hypothetical protein
MKFFAATTLRNGPVDLLPHWLDYYHQLGVDQFAICVLRESMQERLDEINSIIAGLPATLHLFSDWTDERQQIVMRQALEEIGCLRRDWVIHADLDELNEFPCPIDELATAMERGGRVAVHGNFIDRIHARGEFAALTPKPTLAEQYPVECRLTEKILKGCPQKIMLARHEVIVEPGHHTAKEPSGRHVIGAWQDYRVHHFKWRQGVVQRLQWALANVASHDSQWGRETQRFLDFIKPLGSIPVNDPRLEAKHVGGDTPRILARRDRS